ncbi:MAG TPA: hypothetical protein PLX33_12715, partial [Alphaproteobacteria bacterium]|nr:hypothetical protein [Alphaproteobacteria bacterium]
MAGAAAATAAAGAATALVTTSSGAVLEALAEGVEQAQPAGVERLVDSVCRPNCWESCRIYAHVREGRVVKVSMAPMADPRYNRVCLRGLSHAQRIYNANRLKYPMKRAG